MHPSLKHWLKKYFKYYKIKPRLSKQETAFQKSLVEKYQKEKEENKFRSLRATGYKCFSQFEEDGMLFYLFSIMDNPVKTFVEFGSDDGINSNSANLYFHHGWNGLFLDGNEKAIERGKFFFKRRGHKKTGLPTFECAMINRNNINDLITKNKITGEIGLLSIDIDGNDYWVWEAIHCISPQVVIIETHNEFGLNDIVVPYDENYFYPGKHPDYHGASPVAMTNLAHHKGYRLVGSNKLGFNFIYLRNDLLPEIKEVAVESQLDHPSNQQAVERFEEIKDWEYVWNRTF